MSEAKSTEQRIEEALVAAMKSQQKGRVGALRLVKASLQNRRIEKRAPLEEADVLQVLATQAKQRRESIDQFRLGGREDLVAREQGELEVILEFLPAELSEVELRAAIEAAIVEVGATGTVDMGRVMGVLMPKVRGKADGKKVNAMVREALAGGGQP